MIIDMHCHVGKDIEGEGTTFSELKESMDRNNIDKAVVFPFNSDDDTMIDESLNILESTQENDWVIPFLRFNPRKISEQELNRLLEKEFKGVKIHPKSQNFFVDDPKFDWIYKLIGKKRIPIMIHSLAHQDGSKPKRIFDLAKRFPNLKIIIAHFFGNDISLMKEAASYQNIYSDISISSRTLRINDCFRKHGFNRLVLGSDFPYDSQKVALTKVSESNLTEQETDKILFENANKLLTKKD